MKIGIDYHGVITANPSFFYQFNTLAIKNKHHITILSGGHLKDVDEYLHQHRIPYSEIFSLVDYFQTLGLVTFYPNGSFYVPNPIWNSAKAQYCFQNKIDIHIDDSALYGKYFQTPFCLYSSTTKVCQLLKNNITIDFNQPAKNVLNDLQKILKNQFKTSDE